MSEQRDPNPELDDENGIAAQATRQGAGDSDPESPLPDDGSGGPLTVEETLSVEDDEMDIEEGDEEDTDIDDEGAGSAEQT